MEQTLHGSVSRECSWECCTATALPLSWELAQAVSLDEELSARIGQLFLSMYNKLLAVENTGEGREYQFHFIVLPAHGTGVTDADCWNYCFPLYRLLTLGIKSVSCIQMLYFYCDFSHIHEPGLEFCIDIVKFEPFI